MGGFRTRDDRTTSREIRGPNGGSKSKKQKFLKRCSRGRGSRARGRLHDRSRNIREVSRWGWRWRTPSARGMAREALRVERRLQATGESPASRGLTTIKWKRASNQFGLHLNNVKLLSRVDLYKHLRSPCMPWLP